MGTSMQQARGQYCQIWDCVTVKVSPKQRVGLQQCPQWEQLFFSSEILSPRPQEQSTQMYSKVKGTDNAGNAREPSDKPLCFRHLRENGQQAE